MSMNDSKSIQDTLHELGFKMDFWHEEGRLDAICIAKFEGKDLVFKKEYKVNDIANLVLRDYLAQL